MPGSGEPIFQAAAANINPWTRGEGRQQEPRPWAAAHHLGRARQHRAVGDRQRRVQAEKRNEGVTEIAISRPRPLAHHRQRLAERSPRPRWPSWRSRAWVRGSSARPPPGREAHRLDLEADRGRQATGQRGAHRERVAEVVAVASVVLGEVGRVTHVRGHLHHVGEGAAVGGEGRSRLPIDRSISSANGAATMAPRSSTDA